MFSLTTLLIVAGIAFIIGCIVGGVALRYSSPQQQKARSLESKLQETEEQLKSYQQEVTDHFAETATLVNQLTQSYRDVHEHLASDALKLANVDISRQLLSDTNKEGSILEDTAIQQGEYQPPRDWAPKSPGTEGPLSEGYGLGDEHETETGSATK